MAENADLFEDIANLLMCEYLSDLQLPDNIHSAREIMRHIDLRPYSLSQLSDMAQYLYDNNAGFSDQLEAFAFFRQ